MQTQAIIRTFHRLTALCACCLLSACGTLANLNGVHGAPANVPFGGTGLDIQAIAGGFSDADDSSSWLIIPAGIIDLPFSLVGDVISLPYTIYKTATGNQPPEQNSYNQ